jgi:hypothetical protein
VAHFSTRWEFQRQSAACRARSERYFAAIVLGRALPCLRRGPAAEFLSIIGLLYASPQNSAVQKSGLILFLSILRLAPLGLPSQTIFGQ